MKLILTGGGESEYFEEIDQLFLKTLGANPTLLFIPLAGGPESWNDGLERIQTVFSTIHFDNIEMCTDLSLLEWEKLRRFSAIYFDGGNTFDLMEQIRETHSYELLHRFLHQGGVINGDSAGAIVLGSHLETAHFGEEGDENDSTLISYQGLNLLGHWAIHCHYEQQQDAEIEEFSRDFGFPIIALHEDSAVYIEKKQLRVVGKNKIRLFFDKTKLDLHPGSSIGLNDLTN